jgi:hypothetical protein
MTAAVTADQLVDVGIHFGPVELEHEIEQVDGAVGLVQGGGDEPCRDLALLRHVLEDALDL